MTTRVTSNLGKVEEVLKEYGDNTFDGLFCDPPYGFEFMGQKWDYDLPSVEALEEMYRVMKPGAFGMMFGGTRTFHRLAVRIEDVGFTLKDTAMWVYGSGFPKSYNISKGIDEKAGAKREKNLVPTKAGNKPEQAGDIALGATGMRDISEPVTPEAKQWDGYGTALKPAWEPIILFQKPIDGTYVNNILTHGCGALNIDGSRIGVDPVKTYGVRKGEGNSLNLSKYTSPADFEGGASIGRFPANLLHDGSEEVLSLFPNTKSGAMQKEVPAYEGESNTNFLRGKSGPANQHGDSGSAARFFYCAKASQKERNAGLEHFADKAMAAGNQAKAELKRGNLDFASESEKTSSWNKVKITKNNHPTVKPLDLCRYMANLIRPNTEDSKVLVPYSGSGSEMIGAIKAGWSEVHGIEGEEEYVEIQKARIAYWNEIPVTTGFFAPVQSAVQSKKPELVKGVGPLKKRKVS